MNTDMQLYVIYEHKLYVPSLNGVFSICNVKG
jgi:hypothetical protein